MLSNRIRALRKAKGITLETLASRLDISTSHLSRLESGGRSLSMELADQIANALGAGIADLLGLDQPAGFSQDAAPYVATGRTEQPAQIRAGANQSLYKVSSNALDAIDLRPGDLLLIDIGEIAVAAIKPLDVALVQLYAADSLTGSVTLLRQFVPPKLLITNSKENNLLPISMDREDAHIKGVAVSWHRQLR